MFFPFFSLFIVLAVDNYALSKHDKIKLINDSMILCSTHKKNINFDNKYLYKSNTKLRSSIENHNQQKYHVLNTQHKQQHQQHKNHHYEYQQWLPVKRQSTEWCAENDLFKFEINLHKKNKTYHDLFQYKNIKSYRKRYDRYLQYLKYGWYEGYSVGFPGSEMNRYTNNDNITSVPYGCWFDIIQDISHSTPHHHYNDKMQSYVIWINIGEKLLTYKHQYHNYYHYLHSSS